MTGFNLYDLQAANARHEDMLRRAEQNRLMHSLPRRRRAHVGGAVQRLRASLQRTAAFVQAHSVLYGRGLRQMRSLLR